MSLITIFLISLAGFFGAFVDAIVGGGGLITIPALLAAGIPTHITLGTNKFASSFGSVTSVLNYYRSGHMNMKLLRSLLPFSFLGASFGVITVLQLDPAFLNILIIIMVSIIGLITLLNKELGLEDRFKRLTKSNLVKGMFFALLIGFYNGFFGPGTGSFLIFGLVSIYGFDFRRASANAKLLNFMGNVTALILFMINGQILYQVAIPMTLAMLFGSSLGSRMAIQKGANFIKPIFILTSFALVIKMIMDI